MRKKKVNSVFEIGFSVLLVQKASIERYFITKGRRAIKITWTMTGRRVMLIDAVL